VIGGTPTAVTAPASYTVTAANSSGSTTGILSIRVVPAGAPPSSLAYSSNPAVYTVGAAIAANVPSSGGGPVDLYSVAPALPSGLSLDPVTGVVSGTPTTALTASVYVVTAANFYGSSTVNLALTVRPALGNVRVANLSPNVGTLDFCVRATGTTSWGAPVMAGAGGTAGLVFDGGTGVDGAYQVSRYFPYDAGNYDVAVYQKALLGASCSNPLLSATNISLGAGAHKLVAVVGYVGSSTAPPAFASFTDETTVTAGNVAIRFVNAGLLSVPGGQPGPLPAMDVGITTASTGYVLLFSNIAYPGKAPASAIVDVNGYATLPAASLVGALQLTVCPAGLTPATAPAGYCQSTPVPAGMFTGGVVAGAYVMGLAGVPPNTLFCGDNTTPPTAGYNYSLCTTHL
jgi:hypothetical protein